MLPYQRPFLLEHLEDLCNIVGVKPRGVGVEVGADVIFAVIGLGDKLL